MSKEMPALLRVVDVAHELQISRTKAYELMASGELPTVRFDRTVRVRRETLQRWIEEHEDDPLMRVATPSDKNLYYKP